MKILFAGFTCTYLLSGFWAPSVTAEPWRFLVFGDTRSNGTTTDPYYNTQILPELAAEASQMSSKPAFVLVAGDLVNTGSQAAFDAWKSAMSPVYTAGIGVYPVLGNHDATDVSAFINTFGASLPDNGPDGEVDRTYSFTYKNALVLGLDTYVTPNSLNLPWVEQQLANKSDDLQQVFAFGHEPAFKVEHTDCLDNDPVTRDAFWSDLTSAGGRVYFAGHDHFFDAARIDDGNGNPDDDGHQIIVGTGGAPLYADGAYNGDNGPYIPLREYHEADYGYVMVDIDGSDVSMTWMHRTETGTYQAADTFNYSVPDPGTGTMVLLSIGCLTLAVTRWGVARKTCMPA
jgi:hypothetical protein